MKWLLAFGLARVLKQLHKGVEIEIVDRVLGAEIHELLDLE